VVSKEQKDWFGSRLGAVRKRQGVSQLELQKRTGINIWRLESGKIDPSLSTLRKVSRALGVPVEELVKEEG
jgi:transcriptional regulator with XRE-family HTH domain